MSLAACGNATSAVPPSGPAQDLNAAAAAMQTVTSFEFTAKVVTGSQEARITGEFAAPNNLHETAQIGTQSLELIRVGSRTYVRSAANTPWAPATGSPAPADPRAAFRVLESAGDVTLSGSTYAFTLTGAAAAALIQGAATVKGTVTLAGGRIATLSYQATAPAVSVDLAYSNFNGAPAITLPPGL
ncbi:MAG: hypothetical protein WB682_11210 [Candidatus Dormiibacterota bacterium]